MLAVVQTANAPQIHPFSQGMKTDDLVFLSNQLPVDPIDNSVADTITQQTQQVIKNVSAILRAAGTNLGNIAKITFYITDHADIPAITKLSATHFSIGPCVTFVTVPSLPPGVKVEMEAIAVLDNFLISE